MPKSQDSNNIENVCVVCFKSVEIYSCGVCNHPVCFECSTRMRVLCRQNECPICRQVLQKVIFTKSIVPFSELISQFEITNLHDRKFGILFCTSDIQKEYYKILEHHCQLCKDTERKWPFRTFNQLQDHMRKEHELFYCDICVENLKIFTFERRCYSRQELGHHRRKGDPDNKSHRGHPLCEFCDKRFIDSDDLFRHLRREHFYCHFCDADGKNQYYMTMEDLTGHFEDEHYLCKEGECKTNPLIAVFRTNIDMKAHITLEHSHTMSKSATKQARTLELEFSLAPRPRVELRNRLTNNRDNFSQAQAEEAYDDAGNDVTFDASSTQDFPSLAGSSNSIPFRPTSSSKLSRGSSKFSQEDFPSLGGNRNATTAATKSASQLQTVIPGGGKKSIAAITVHSKPKQHKPKPAANSKPQKHQNRMESLDDFPALATCKTNGTTTTVRINSPNLIAPKVSLVKANLHQSNVSSTSSRPLNTFQDTTESFPTLGKPLKITKPQWIQQKPKKKVVTTKKVNPAPVLPPSDMNQFPSLQACPKPSNSDQVKKKIDNKKSTDKPANSFVKPIKVEGPSEQNNNHHSKVKPNQDSYALHSKEKIAQDPVLGPPPGFNVDPARELSALDTALNNTLNDFPSLSSSVQATENSCSYNSYNHPNNFQKRNSKLFQKITTLMDNEKLREFKIQSGLFRTDEISTPEYYVHCKKVLDKNFEEIFPELLVLLPDICKQKELYHIYDGKNKKHLLQCEQCKQIIKKNELSEHYKCHTLQNQFPDLISSQEVVKDVWKK